MKLAVFDMEGTLTADPTVWELMHRRLGTWETHGLVYWRRFRAGELHYDEFARMDVAAWAGAPERMLDEAVDEVPLTRGSVRLLRHIRALGYRTAIVSNGLVRLARRLAAELGIDRVAANRAVVRDGRLTGELELLVPYRGKGETMMRIAEELNVQPREIVAVGDGEADVEMFRIAGRSIAFLPQHGSVAAAADHVITEPDISLAMEYFER